MLNVWSAICGVLSPRAVFKLVLLTLPLADPVVDCTRRQTIETKLDLRNIFENLSVLSVKPEVLTATISEMMYRFWRTTQRIVTCTINKTRKRIKLSYCKHLAKKVTNYFEEPRNTNLPISTRDLIYRLISTASSKSSCAHYLNPSSFSTGFHAERPNSFIQSDGKVLHKYTE